MLDYIQVPWHFLIAPFFYMFLIHYLEIAKRSYRIFKIIWPLFIISIILQITFVLIYSNKIWNVEQLNYLYERYTSIEEVISFIISLTVFTYAYIVLSKKERLFTKILTFDNLRWIHSFFIIGAFGYLFWLFALIIKIKMNFSGFIFSYYPLRIYTTLLIYWISYQSIIRLNLLNERRDLRAEILKQDRTEFKLYTNSKNKSFIAIENYIIENNKFIESNLTRDALADELKISKNKLSYLINNEANKTYIEYMNTLRVNYAKKILIDDQYKQYTVTAIGLESGFNSKSTFYHIFKKHTGMTPSQYQKKKP